MSSAATAELLSPSIDSNNQSAVSSPTQRLPRSTSGVEDDVVVGSDKNTNHRKKKSKKREVYRYQTEWLVSSIAWSNEPSESFNLAVSSYIEDYTNWIQLISLCKDDYDEEIETIYAFKHPYPATKILWCPRQFERNVKLPNLLATTADYLRLWRVINSRSRGVLNQSDSGTSSTKSSNGNLSSQDTEVKLECLLNSNQGLKHCAPLTSFDWNEIDPTIIATSSVDTTCAIWDIETSKLIGKSENQQSADTSPHISNNNPNSSACNLRSQIVAHNHEVYDISFSRSGSGKDVFVTAGGDGSVRMFDLRRLSTSTMLYEADRITPSDSKALVRVCCNKQDSNLVGAFAINSKDILILDLRSPGRPLLTLRSHTSTINGISWATHSAHHICSAADDQQALIWELSNYPNPVEEPLLAYRADGKINVISWSGAHSDWIAIGFENYVELLRV